MNATLTPMRLLDTMIKNRGTLLMLTIGEAPRMEADGKMLNLHTRNLEPTDTRDFVVELFGPEVLEKLTAKPVELTSEHDGRQIVCRLCHQAGGVQVLVRAPRATFKADVEGSCEI